MEFTNLCSLIFKSLALANVEVLRIQSRALSVLGEYSTTEWQPQPCFSSWSRVQICYTGWSWTFDSHAYLRLMTNWDFHHACLKNVFLNNKETQKPDSAVFAELNRQVMKNNLTLTNCGLVISMFVFPPSFSHGESSNSSIFGSRRPFVELYTWKKPLMSCVSWNFCKRSC